jgi:hypothetical protein
VQSIRSPWEGAVVKFVQCVRRKPDVTIQEFRRIWRSYQAKATELAKALNAVGLTFSTTLAVDENLQVMLVRGTSEPYDGLVELRISNAPKMLDRLRVDPARSIWDEFKQLQNEFIDLENSSFFFASEEVAVRR